MDSFIPRKVGLAALSLILMAAGGIAAPRAQTGPAAPSTTHGQMMQDHMATGGHMGPRRGMSPKDAVERRITDLHQRLRITVDQEEQWGKVAQVMRDDAQAVEATASARQQKLATMSAVDNLRSFQQLAQAHADGLNKLADAFAALYDKMSDDQKKNADTVFRYQGRHQPRHTTVSPRQ